MMNIPNTGGESNVIRRDPTFLHWIEETSHKMRKKGTNMKRFLSLIFVMTLVLGLVPTAFAADSDSISLDSDHVRIEEFDNSILYTYQDDNVSYSSQITIDGIIQFAYIANGQNVIYESSPVSLSEIFSNIDTSKLSKDDIIDNSNMINGYVLKNLNAFEVTSTTGTGIFGTVTSDENIAGIASTPISTMLTSTFGSDFSKRLLGVADKTYNGKSYTVYCYGYQTTYEINNAGYEFAAGQAVTAITAWIAAGGFNYSLQWFLSASGATVSTVNGISYLVNSIRGTSYAYGCDRTRIVTVPAYSSSTMYWAGWTIKCEFIDTGSTWDIHKYFENKHTDYDDVSDLMQKGFNNFVSYYLQ